MSVRLLIGAGAMAGVPGARITKLSEQRLDSMMPSDRRRDRASRTVGQEGLTAHFNKVAGYGVSIIKAGAKLVGHDAGPARVPLTDLKPAEMDAFAALIQN